MKKTILFSSTALLSAFFMSCDLDALDTGAGSAKKLETPEGKYGYAIGVDMGTGARQINSNINIDYSMVLQGIKDQLDTTKPALMNDSQVEATLQEINLSIRKARKAKDSIAMEERKQKAVENLSSQNSFLEKNKTEAGVVSTESGLQYITLKEGEGNIAVDGDTVVVHYTGTLLDGTEFDSSVKRNQPLSITLGEGQLIKGWVEMLRLMNKGQKVKTWIPSSIGYGEVGNPRIPGNSLLVFEMELLDIKPAKK